MMHATTVVEYEEWACWFQLPLSIAVVGQVFFVYYYLGAGRPQGLSINARLTAGAVLGRQFVQTSMKVTRPRSRHRHRGQRLGRRSRSRRVRCRTTSGGAVADTPALTADPLSRSGLAR
jgi:hypothetical protein